MADLTTNKNYLQPTSFKLVIDRRNYPNIEYFATAISHPSVSATAAELPRSRVNVPFSADKLTFSELDVNILLDENMTAYTEMYEWIKRLVEHTHLDEDNPQEADITLSILSSHNNSNKQIRYIDCIPTSIGNINFQSTVTDVEYISVPITFRFSYFEVL